MKSKKEIRISELKYRIELGISQDIENENGFFEEGFTPLKKVWAKVSDISYRKYYGGNSDQIEDTTLFIIRYQEDAIINNGLIRFKNNIYKVANIDNINFENKWIYIYATILNRGSSNG